MHDQYSEGIGMGIGSGMLTVRPGGHRDGG